MNALTSQSPVSFKQASIGKLFLPSTNTQDGLTQKPSKNIDYYEKVQVEELKKLADLGGITECQDLNHILPYLQQAEHVLEIGGGYGRILNYFIKQKLNSQVDVIEPSNRFYHYLTNVYPKDQYGSQFNIMQEYVEKYQTEKKYNVILWMWSQLIEFDSETQLSLIKKIKKLLAPNGILVIETIPSQVCPRFATQIDEKTFILDFKDAGKVKIFRSTYEDFKAFSDEAAFKNLKNINYSLSSGIQRAIYLLFS